eukprot:SAG31_NODE_2810_length_5061_cov_12.226522_2_plen_149_part_00
MNRAQPAHNTHKVHWRELDTRRTHSEIRQYFIESDHEASPYDRAHRNIVYQRAKNCVDTLPLGTRRDVYQEGYEWIGHSLWPKHMDPASMRATIGGPSCAQPYSASVLNVSAMSYGSLSANAILALNGGAKLGGFYHNTGEVLTAGIL